MVLAMLLSLPMNVPAHATTVAEGDVENLAHVSDLNSKHKDINFILNGLNYYNPINFKLINDNQYSISLFDKLYEYGKVRLLIVPNNSGKLSSVLEKEVIFNETLEKDKEIYVNLEDNSEYLYNIYITDDNDEFISTHYGLAKIENGHIEYKIQYISDEETVQTEEKVKSDSSVEIQGIVLKNSIFEDEQNNSTTQANTIYSDRNVYGRISSGTDEDYYKITFTSAGTANFWLGDIYTNCDYDLYVYDGSGTQVASSMNAGQAQELISNFSVTKSTYYVKVKAYNNKFNVSKYYFLRVRLFSEDSSGMAWPTISTQINSCYHCTKYDPNPNIIHNGVDIYGSSANPILAMTSSKIRSIGTSADPSISNGLGKNVWIDHDIENPNSTGSNDKYFSSRYAHMSEILDTGITVGSAVQRGKILGYIGGTGRDPLYAEHLHFEVYVGPSVSNQNVRINPIRYYTGTWTCQDCGGNCLNTTRNLNNAESLQIKNNNMTMHISESSNDTMDTVNIAINNEFTLDLESLIQMSLKELEKYGIDEKILNIIIESIQKSGIKNDEFNSYINILSNKL